MNKKTVLKNIAESSELYKEKFNISQISPRSILIGGGTPSLLSPAQIKRLLDMLHEKLNLNDCNQITLEAEPKTLLGDSGLEKLKIMKSQNINRLSLGVQSFDDDILKKMGRVHSSKESLTAIEKIRDAGFDNLSIDLIYGFPGLTIEKWISTLKKVMSLDIDAYQLYRLRIIPHGDKSGSILSQNNKFPEIFPDFMQILLMKEFGILYSNQNGYTEMSRRLFCKSREYSSAYLKDHTDRLYDVIGIGLSSWINIQGIMAINTSESLKEYYSYIDAGKLPVNRGKIKTCDDYERWAIVLPLKHGGVSKKKFSELTKKKLDEIFKEKINRLKKHGLLTDNGDFISLTEKGAFFADEVCIQFYHPDYIPFPKSDYNSRELNPFNP